MDRRKFFSSLAVAPVAAMVPVKLESDSNLHLLDTAKKYVIQCDLRTWTLQEVDAYRKELKAHSLNCIVITTPDLNGMQVYELES